MTTTPTRTRSWRSRRDPLTVTVTPEQAQAAIDAGKPLVVDVDQYGSGWWLYEVLPTEYRVYRDGEDRLVPHAEVRIRS